MSQSKFTFELFDGIPLEKDGDTTYQKQVEFKSLTAGEIFTAQDRAEEVRKTNDGYELIVSPTKLSREIVRLSVRRVGDLPGLSLAVMSKMTSRDLELLYAKHEEYQGIENAILQKRLDGAEKLGKQ